MTDVKATNASKDLESSAAGGASKTASKSAPKHGFGRHQKRSGNASRDSRKSRPRRGGPGVLLTCEPGREKKCLREALDILTHYCYNGLAHECVGSDKVKRTGTDDSESSIDRGSGLSLEEEIAMLREGSTTEEVLRGEVYQGRDQDSKGGKKTSSLFVQYETGCRGTVFVMYNEGFKTGAIANEGVHSSVVSTSSQLPNATETAERKNKGTESSREDEGTANEKPRKKIKMDVGGEMKRAPSCITKATRTAFDPVEIVRRILHDAHSGANIDAPSSRFVTRMVPAQVTCFASLDEITATAKRLLELFRPGDYFNDRAANKKYTFEIVFKRRICSNVTRDECIKAVASVVLCDCHFSVDLRQPMFSIIVEICRTLVGMSVVPNFRSVAYHNFNLFEARKRGESSHNIVSERKNT